MAQLKTSTIDDHLREVLRNEYSKRRARNQRYTLHAFSKHLNVSSGTLSEILHAKRKVGMRVYARLIDKLGSSAIPTDFNFKNNGTDFQTLYEDEYRLISDWYHFAIFELAKNKKFKSDPSWIATKLGITKTEVEAAIDRLLRCKLLLKEKDKWKPSKKPFTTTCDIPSAAIREATRQELAKATDSIDTVPVELRDLSSYSFNFKPERINEAKEALKKFRREFVSLFEDEEGSEVYLLGLNFFPITKLNTQKANIH